MLWMHFRNCLQMLLLISEFKQINKLQFILCHEGFSAPSMGNSSMMAISTLWPLLLLNPYLTKKKTISYLWWNGLKAFLFLCDNLSPFYRQPPQYGLPPLYRKILIPFFLSFSKNCNALINKGRLTLLFSLKSSGFWMDDINGNKT